MVFAALRHHRHHTNRGLQIYGHDSYPLGFDCSHPTIWPDGALPTTFWRTHLNQSPTTPYSIEEFQGGSFDPWGGPGFSKCGVLVNYEFVRIFYKNVIASAAKTFSLYMIYGGTNWGNLGHPGGYTSYDYAAAIAENRSVERQKYSETKLIANFVKVSPAYLAADPKQSNTTSVFTNTSSLTVTSVGGNNSATTFYIVRHYNYSSLSTTPYKLFLPTTSGNLSIPQLGGSLKLGPRDSKVHVSDYTVGTTNLLYSTAEIFTWNTFENRTVLLVYGEAGEHHELAVVSSNTPKIVQGESSSLALNQTGAAVIVAWNTSTVRSVVQIGQLEIFLLGKLLSGCSDPTNFNIDKASAYNYWVPELSNSASKMSFDSTESRATSIIVKAGYLVRGASVQGNKLYLSADFNATTSIEVIGVPTTMKYLLVNGEQVQHQVNGLGDWSANIPYKEPSLVIPELSTLNWKYIDNLPEVQPGYEDSSWTIASLPMSNNTVRNLTTPTSLYSSDYGYHTGSLIYRGHFTAQESSANFSINTQGGWAFGHSLWLNQTFIGSYAGVSTENNTNATYKLSSLQSGSPYTMTILIDHMGMEESGTVGTEWVPLFSQSFCQSLHALYCCSVDENTR